MGKRAADEGTIGRRENGTYYGSVRLEGKYRWCYGKTRKEVAGKLKALQQKYDQGVDLSADKVSVEVFLLRWLKETVKQKNKYRTYVSYKQVVDTHIVPALGKILLSALRPDHIQTLITQLSEANKAPRTVRNVRAVLRRALSQALRWRLVSYNAASLVEPPRIEQHEVQPFTKAEARKFLASIKGHPLEVLYLLALLLGLRQGEVLGLLISSINLDTGTVAVTGALQWQAGKLVRVSTKTKSSVRVLPLPLSILPLLTAHIAHQQASLPDSGYLFTSASGGPLSPFTVIPQFKALLKAAELRPMRFHDLRHSCATFLIARGEHPRTVMDVLGHSQISTTMNTYGHILDETRTAAIAGLDALLSEG